MSRKSTKTERQVRILEIIAAHETETQEELCERLNRAGFLVTQATVSRDIRELGLIKAAGPGGRSVYRAVGESEDMSEKYFGVLKNGFVSLDAASHLLVVRTVAGMAMAVAAALDAMDHSEIVGSIAGDDTVLVALRSKDGMQDVCRRIREITGR